MGKIQGIRATVIETPKLAFVISTISNSWDKASDSTTTFRTSSTESKLKSDFRPQDRQGGILVSRTTDLTFESRRSILGPLAFECGVRQTMSSGIDVESVPTWRVSGQARSRFRSRSLTSR
jgi:hypothetical protein